MTRTVQIEVRNDVLQVTFDLIKVFADVFHVRFETNNSTLHVGSIAISIVATAVAAFTRATLSLRCSDVRRIGDSRIGRRPILGMSGVLRH